jgi:hypothetical protein
MNNQPEINTHSYAELVDNSVSYQPLEQSYTQELQEYPEHPCKNCAYKLNIYFTVKSLKIHRKNTYKLIKHCS